MARILQSMTSVEWVRQMGKDFSQSTHLAIKGEKVEPIYTRWLVQFPRKKMLWVRLSFSKLGWKLNLNQAKIRKAKSLTQILNQNSCQINYERWFTEVSCL